MTVKELKEILNTIDDEKEILIENLATDYSGSDYERYISKVEIDVDGDIVLK